jgi:hypothetical protein
MTTRIISCLGVLSLVLMLGGCGGGGSYETQAPTVFNTTVTMGLSSVTLSGSTSDGTNTADLVTVEDQGLAQTLGASTIPTSTTISSGSWSYKITTLTTKTYTVRWFKSGLQIACQDVTVTF